MIFTKRQLASKGDRRMPTEELTALVAIIEAGQPIESSSNHPNKITPDRVKCTGNELVRSGHLPMGRQGEYQLTSRGRATIPGEAIRLVACQDEAWAKCRMEKLEQLYNEIDQHLNDPLYKGKQVIISR